MKQLRQDMGVATRTSRCSRCGVFPILLEELGKTKGRIRDPHSVSKDRAREIYVTTVRAICSEQSACKDYTWLITDATLIFFRNFLQRVENATVNRMPAPVPLVELPREPLGFFTTDAALQKAIGAIRSSLSEETLRVLRVFDLGSFDSPTQATLVSFCEQKDLLQLVPLKDQFSFLSEKVTDAELLQFAIKLSKMLGAAYALNHNQSSSTGPQVDAVVTLLEFYRDKTISHWRTSLKPLPPVIDDEPLHGTILGRLVEIELKILASGQTLADVLSPGEQFLHTYLQRTSPQELVAQLREENPSLFKLSLH